MVRKSSKMSLSNKSLSKSKSKSKLGKSNSQINLQTPKIRKNSSNRKLAKTTKSTEALHRVMKLVPVKTTQARKKIQKITVDVQQKKVKASKSKTLKQKITRKTQKRYKSASSVDDIVKVHVIRNSDLNLSPTALAEPTQSSIYFCKLERQLEAYK